MLLYRNKLWVGDDLHGAFLCQGNGHLPHMILIAILRRRHRIRPLGFHFQLRLRRVNQMQGRLASLEQRVCIDGVVLVVPYDQILLPTD